MIETPRAALCAGEIAEAAEFFSFGTNDLTQMTFGFSRDDVEARMMTLYLERGLIPANPFETIDREGVGELVRIAVERGKAANPRLKLGVCGEHGGDPASIDLFARGRARLRELLALPRPDRPPRRRPGAASHRRRGRSDRRELAGTRPSRLARPSERSGTVPVMAIPDEDVARVRAATDLAALIGEHTALKRVGTRFVGLCPFHGERTPSFSVNAEEGLYYCFGCQVSGDAITFVRAMEGCDFVEAVERLAGRAGITIRDDADPAASAERGRRQHLYEALGAAADFYHDRLLRHPDAGRARHYLRSRGYDGDVVRRFRLGFAPAAYDELVRALRLPARVLRDAGLAHEGARGGLIDTFRERVIFPVYDPSNRTIALGGRILPEELRQSERDPGPKYRNSAESPIYAKRRTLYGLNWAKAEVARTGEAVVCEGYTDVIGFFQAGVPRAVATCGTALTEDHFRLLARFCSRVVLAFDADERGAERRGQALRMGAAPPAGAGRRRPAPRERPRRAGTRGPCSARRGRRGSPPLPGFSRRAGPPGRRPEHARGVHPGGRGRDRRDRRTPERARTGPVRDPSRRPHPARPGPTARALGGDPQAGRTRGAASRAPETNGREREGERRRGNEADYDPPPRDEPGAPAAIGGRDGAGRAGEREGPRTRKGRDALLLAIHRRSEVLERFDEVLFVDETQRGGVPGAASVVRPPRGDGERRARRQGDARQAGGERRPGRPRPGRDPRRAGPDRDGAHPSGAGQPGPTSPPRLATRSAKPPSPRRRRGSPASSSCCAIRSSSPVIPSTRSTRPSDW